MMDQSLSQPILFLLALIAWEVIKLAVARVFKKTVATDYITATQCVNCKDKSAGEDRGVREALSEIRGVVLVIAMKVGISEHEIVKLVSK